MAELLKMLYGDGVTSVSVNDFSVTFTQDGVTVIISHAAMREIMLSWERHEARETE